ncbi:hypothetical protein pEaSNUABM52_00247 [Erwinia phage pEp_SNUABM_52]|nr:hypothetical protein pEaSNUABM52_00247 [Erwinia phage pEp_SNUABM_52]
MKRIHVQTLPLDALNGLVHGFHHHERHHNFGRVDVSLYYMDVTAQAAQNSLFSILKKEKHNIKPVGYDSISSVQGKTLPEIAGTVLSTSLLHVDRVSIASNLNDMFGSMRRSGLTKQSTITIYGEPGIEKLMHMANDVAYAAYSEADNSSIRLGHEGTTTNLPLDTLMKLILDTEKNICAMIHNSPANVYTFGPELTILDPEWLSKFLSCVKRTGKSAHLHPELHRKFFDAEISIYEFV